MIFPVVPRWLTGCLTVLLLVVAGGAVVSLADPATAGPTLHLAYGTSGQTGNSVSQFMYFVPLISAEQILLITNVGNSQCARVVSYSHRVKGGSFTATCEFEFTGTGSQHDVFDHAIAFQKHDKELKSGHTLPHHLKSIDVEGDGSGTVEIEGTITNGQYCVNLVELRFNSRGQISPVSITLEDVRYHKGMYLYDNETVARVNALTFRRTSEQPKMEVSLASVKKKDAVDSTWQNFLGSIKGVAASLLLPPLNVQPEGQQAMLDFGLALALRKPDFTFPFAPRLKNATATP